MVGRLGPEPKAQPTGESWARASRPIGHRDMLLGHPMTEITRGQMCTGQDQGRPMLLDCHMAQAVLPS